MHKASLVLLSDNISKTVAMPDNTGPSNSTASCTCNVAATWSISFCFIILNYSTAEAGDSPGTSSGQQALPCQRNVRNFHILQCELQLKRSANSQFPFIHYTTEVREGSKLWYEFLLEKYQFFFENLIKSFRYWIEGPKFYIRAIINGSN